MSKSTIPVAATSATILVTRRAKKALPTRHKTSSTLRNPHKQSSLHHHKKMLRPAPTCVTKRSPLPNKSTHLPKFKYHPGEWVALSSTAPAATNGRMGGLLTEYS